MTHGLRRRKVSVGLAALLLVAGSALTNTRYSFAKTPENQPSVSRQLIKQLLSVNSAKPEGRTEPFQHHGNNSENWVGADSTYSVVLKDRTISWLFSDTMPGTVINNEQVGMGTQGFINNSFVLERDGRLEETITGWNALERTSIFQAEEDDTWYWLDVVYIAANGTLYAGVNYYSKFGPGLWERKWGHTSIATIDFTNWKVTDLIPANVESGIQWTSWFERTEGKTYLCDVDSQGLPKQTHVARVTGHDISRIGKWEYWNGSGRSKLAQESIAILNHVASEYSVAKPCDGYLLVAQDISESFPSSIVAYTSCSPTGLFEGKTELFKTPENGLTGSYNAPDAITYNAHIHPHLSDNGKLAISYNVNILDNERLFDDVPIYRPRRWTITIG